MRFHDFETAYLTSKAAGNNLALMLYYSDISTAELASQAGIPHKLTVAVVHGKKLQHVEAPVAAALDSIEENIFY